MVMVEKRENKEDRAVDTDSHRFERSHSIVRLVGILFVHFEQSNVISFSRFLPLGSTFYAGQSTRMGLPLSHHER